MFKQIKFKKLRLIIQTLHCSQSNGKFEQEKKRICAVSRHFHSSYILQSKIERFLLWQIWSNWHSKDTVIWHKLPVPNIYSFSTSISKALHHIRIITSCKAFLFGSTRKNNSCVILCYSHVPVVEVYHQKPVVSPTKTKEFQCINFQIKFI